MSDARLAISKYKLGMARQLDRLCDEYESRRAGGETPSIADYLAKVSEAQREQLCVELVRIQMDLRRQRGEIVTIREVLEEIPDELRGAVQARVETTAAESTVCSADSRAPSETVIDDDLPPEIPSFEPIERVAAGGMGIVWRMRDLRMGRDVAVKVMKAEATRNHAVIRRFKDEATICAQLNHPFIVPVHAIGQLFDGRPYYVMKFVHGMTLADLFRANSQTTADRIELLRIFQKVCEAIAYAHRKRVVHRDLKPQNVMVGRHGEVQLMDWGLAGILGADRGTSAEAKANSIVKTSQRRASEQTQFGDVLGTPSYMSPEQARGLVSEIDETSDVFSLGAILCELLTGKPPYTGTNQAAIEISAASANLDEAYAALGASDADPLLVDIARKCLATRKELRFTHGDELAKAIAGYLSHLQDLLEAERLRLERERVLELERRRRHTLYLRFAAAASMLICAAVAMGVLIVQHQRDMASRSSAALQRITQQIESGDFVAAQAELNAAARANVLSEQFARFDTDLRLAKRLDAIRNDYYTWQDGWFDCYTALDQYQGAFRAHGLESANVNQPNLNARELASQIRASSVSVRLVSAVDDWAWLAHREAQRAKSEPLRQNYHVLRNNLLAAVQLVDVNSPANATLRNHELWDNPRSLVRVADTVNPSELSPELLVLISKLLPPEHKEPFLVRCHVARPADFWINIELGRLILEEITSSIDSDSQVFSYPATKAFSVSPSLPESARRRASQAVGFYRAAVAKATDRVGVRLDLAAALAAAGQTQLAILECDQAIQLAAYSTSSDKPLSSQAFHLLGLAHRTAGRFDDAIKYLFKAKEQNETCAFVQWNLAATLKDMGRIKEAAEVLRSLLASNQNPSAQAEIRNQLQSMPSTALEELGI
jgi:serine/threonine protein kinase